jgi:hypothetical protein
LELAKRAKTARIKGERNTAAKDNTQPVRIEKFQRGLPRAQ